MRKTTIKFVALSICLFANFVYAQNSTFERSYPGLSEYSIIGVKTIELSDGNYLIIGSKNIRYSNEYKDWVLTKIDKNGYTIWHKEIETIISKFRPSNQVLITKDNKILVLSIKDIDSISTLNISKFDFSGNEISSLNLLSDTSFNGCALKAIDEGGYLIVTGDDLLANQNIKVIKLDINFNIIWEKVFFLTPRTTIGESFSINKWGNNYYSIGARRNILRINSEGSIISQMDYFHRYISETKEGNILVSRSMQLSLLNPNGTSIQSFNFENNVGPAIQTRDGNFLVFLFRTDFNAPNSIRKMDTSGNTLWSTNISGEAFCINELSDNFLLGSGRFENNLWAYKTDSLGIYTAINILSPIGGENLYTFNGYLIRWHSTGVEKVDLFYSTNDGNTWQLITSNFDADSGEFNWMVPTIFTDKIKLKIQDSNHSNIFNLTEHPIFISIYQPLDFISINEIFMRIGNNGMGSHNPIGSGTGGYLWPGGDSANISAIFADGLVWGGKVNGEIKVNGSTYRYGLQPGRILEDGSADKPTSTQSKIFKIRKNWQTLPEGVFKDRLEYDYNHWPVAAGAPWDDVNEDGFYSPGIDEPIYIGDETLFYVANDLDTVISKNTYGSDPIGLEFQTTVFGFNRDDLKDVVFKRYRVINKSNTEIAEMYFSYWADDDLGNAQDDFIGCDTSLALGYSWNSDNDDETGFGLNPPAVGHLLIQEPIVKSLEEDSALFNFKWIKGFRNLNMTSFCPIFKSDLSHDPPLGVYEGSLQLYNYLMRGKKNDGNYFINPHTGNIDTFSLAGDPVTGLGWYEGTGWPGGQSDGDRRFYLNTGYFNMAPGDTQEIVIAIPIARGTDNINSITRLKELTSLVKEFYSTELVEMINIKQPTITPDEFILYQNYPNPFNPKTTIEYEVPEKSFVTIKIFDILGREVQTLVNNEEKVRWRHKVVFDASSFASGVYFYRMQADSFTETKKMMVLK